MSVVQISRIQQRRGRRISATGFPQLASGELGWAIDTQELYIGNGAVSEGAPYVGNSKVITEHDDILQFVALYQYKKNTDSIQTGILDTEPVTNTLQNLLDKIVYASAFGVIGDNTTNNTIALQRAVDQLWLTSAAKNNKSNRVVLYLEPGEYIINGEIKLPSNAKIVGAGIDSTVIIQTGNNAIFRMVDDRSTPGSYIPVSGMARDYRPRNILISNLTLETHSNTSRVVYLDNTDKTLFDRVRFFGTYTDLSTVPPTSRSAVEIRSLSEITLTTNVIFNHCEFDSTGYGIYSESDQDNISIVNSIFYQLYDAIGIGGGITGALNSKITDCYFDRIVRYGINIKKGYGNTSSNNKFMSVGNNGQGPRNAKYPIVKFDTENNQSNNDYFDRNRIYKDILTTDLLPFLPTVQSSGLIYDNFNFHKTINVAPDAVNFLRFPLIDSGKYVIDYVIKQNKNIPSNVDHAVRSGILNLNVYLQTDNGLLNNNSSADIVDTFSYSGDSNVENIQFSVELQRYATGADNKSIPDTLTIKIKNPKGNGTMNYTYRMLSQ